MKKILALVSAFLLLPAFLLFVNAQKKTMTLTSRSKEAINRTQIGILHLLNIENAQAYEEFRQALELDKNFTLPLVFMANLSIGEAQKTYADLAIKSAEGKSAGEKLLATTVAPENIQGLNSETWKKLYALFPDDDLAGYYYVTYRESRKETFEAAKEYISKFPGKAWMYNTIAYYYMNDLKDFEMAKENFTKYILLYPEGCNPYDSMGEYYLNVGDYENSEKYYNMALEKYPFNISSLDKLKEIKELKKKNR